jgi:hypothetical protein
MKVNSKLKLNSLNICFKDSKSLVEDSVSAVIYKQFPVGNDYNTLNISLTIDLFFNQTKLDALE